MICHDRGRGERGREKRNTCKACALTWALQPLSTSPRPTTLAGAAMSRCNQRTKGSMQKRPGAKAVNFLLDARALACRQYSNKHYHLAINRAPAILPGAMRPATSSPRMAHAYPASLCQGSATPFHRSQLATTESVIGSPCGLCTKLDKGVWE